MEVFETVFLLLSISKTHFYIFNVSFYQHTKMFHLDDITDENNDNHNKKWRYIPDYPYSILILGGSGSGKTKA